MTDKELTFPYLNQMLAMQDPNRIQASHTLAELLKRVEHSQHNTSPHQVINLTALDTDSESIPPPYPFVLSFHNLSYTVKTQKAKFFGPRASNGSAHKLLLNNVSGEAREGEITAVLGESGSGKSTLIDALYG